MNKNLTDFSFQTFVNPVYPRSFPDPFVLKYCGEYFAYCTGVWHDGNVFGVLHSRDLVNWTQIGGAMKPLESDAPHYWAPEVTYSNGKFYLYYSVGNETLMEIRVAVSDTPEGGFVDSGKRLTTEDFAIDAHVFTDENNKRYLFYATDFLSHSHIGTGTVVDKMLDFFTLEGKPRPVTRAKYDWQIYDPNRLEKGGVRWHTVEGAFVLKRKGIYYEMFSGGNWQNISYGVSFAITDDIEKNEEWLQFSDGENVLPILRTIPGKVIGPGHNCAIRGVNNRELFCIYHRWSENERVLAIDRMDFAAERMFIKGASFSEQIAPFQPAFADFFDGEFLSENWQTSGGWQISNNEAVSGICDRSEIICRHKAESFLCEFSFRAVETIDETSAHGFYLLNESEKTFEFSVFPNRKRIKISWFVNGEQWEQTFDLSDEFDVSAFHLLRVEIDGFSLKILLDESELRFETSLEKFSNQIAFFSENMQAAFSGFALTEGFEDLFVRQNSRIENHGWQIFSGEGVLKIENRQLFLSNQDQTDSIFAKGAANENFEFLVNLRFIESFGEGYEFGFVLLNQHKEITGRFNLRDEIVFLSDGNSEKFAFPKDFAFENYHQFGFLKLGKKIFFSIDEHILGEIAAPEGKLQIGLFCRNSALSLEMVRLTVL